MDFIIVSDNYWPGLTLDGMQLHPSLDQKLKTYSEEYSVLKKPRKLNLLPQLGQVELTLDFEDGTSRDFCVTPLQVCPFCLCLVVLVLNFVLLCRQTSSCFCRRLSLA